MAKRSRIGAFFFPGLRHSIYTLWKHARIRRLFKEDKDVEGVGWYAKKREDFWHVPLNTIRFFVLIILAPIYAILRLSPTSRVAKFNALHVEEPICAPDAILYRSPGDGRAGEFEPMGYRPRWLLKVEFRGKKRPKFDQVPVEGNSEIAENYMAISYPMDSAFELFKEAGYQTKEQQPGQNRRWSLGDRRRISRQILRQYACARYHDGTATESAEYIWLDEFCLSPKGLEDEKEIKKERKKELGRLTDIFRNAKKVLVYCHTLGCGHTTLDCPWATRLFTLEEILRARQVITMTRHRERDPPVTLQHRDACDFKNEMQREAAERGHFHLSTILLHFTNAGSQSWQSVIQALVVEAIRRDEAGNYVEHNCLGRVLNGLLPRCAHPEDLKGEDGWADLAWLLELNQGYYNAATLAAICNANLTPAEQEKGLPTGQPEGHGAGYRWWGKPILPLVGNERLEPVATAFPVVVKLPCGREGDSEQDEGKPNSGSKGEPVLSILAPKAVRIHHALRRDREGLYRHESMVCLRNLMYIIATIMIQIGIPLLVIQDRYLIPGAILMYLAFVVVVCVELLASTIYIVREGWVFFPDNEEWKEDPSPALEKRDPRFKKLHEWGTRQMIPKWDPPGAVNSTNSRHRLISGNLVDLQNKVYTRVTVIDGAYPDLMVLLAVHGTGITGILLRKPNSDDVEEEDTGPASRSRFGDMASGFGKVVMLSAGMPTTDGEIAPTGDYPSFTDSEGRQEVGSPPLEHDGEEEESIQVLTKVGMANVPAYVLSNSDHLGTIFVGGHLPKQEEVPETGMWNRAKSNLLVCFREIRRHSASAKSYLTLRTTNLAQEKSGRSNVSGRDDIELEEGRSHNPQDTYRAGEFIIMKLGRN